MSDDGIVRYSVDRGGRLSRVNRAWDEFALANDSPHLVGTPPLGSLLLDHISDKTTRLIYGYLLERVRNTGRTARFRCRCDSPQMRRLIELSILQGDAGLLEFRAETVRSEPQMAAPIFDAARPRSDELITMCSWCNRVEGSEDEWIEIDDAVAEFSWFEQPQIPSVTHGICYSCASVMLDVATDPELAASGIVEVGSIR